MKTKIFKASYKIFLVLIIIMVAILIAGTIAKANLAKKYPAPGQLVDVGGYQMHIYCTGQGSPTVMLEAGSGDSSLIWAKVQPEIAEFTRVCSYDRAGLGWSDPSPHPRTANTMVEELHNLMINANVDGPYVFVGHSLGGMLVRMFAHKYPDEIVGMVLVDSLHEARMIRNPDLAEAIQEATGQFRMFALLNSTGITALAPQSIPNPGLPADANARNQALMATTDALATWLAELKMGEANCAEALALQINSFGNLPLIVISAGHGDRLASFSDAENQQLWENMQIEQTELAALSTQGKQIVAEKSGHHVQLDQPELVIGAIRQVIEAIQ
jgi:pimeloyl-ACP methyl ester carboxylesterase